MNYRHAFHAGNFADCVKHALLVGALGAMRRKPAPLFMLDTHAGAGGYDLAGEAAARTDEARAGIIRLLAGAPAAVLEPYLSIVRASLVDVAGVYTGSPMIAAALLRPCDRLACCEAEPDAHAVLARRFAGARGVAVHRRDGWEALGALLPPAERRGLTLIDPPYERPDEHRRVVAAMAVAAARFPSGVVMAWYPIKHRTPTREMREGARAAGLRDVIAAELCLRAPDDPTRLNGCGLLILNPPYRFEDEAGAILDALLSRLGAGEAGAFADVARVADE